MARKSSSPCPPATSGRHLSTPPLSGRRPNRNFSRRRSEFTRLNPLHAASLNRRRCDLREVPNLGQVYHDTQARRIVFDRNDAAVMQAHAAASDRPRPEPGMVRGSLEPHESFEHASSVGDRPRARDPRWRCRSARSWRRATSQAGSRHGGRHAVFQPLSRRLAAPGRSVRDCPARPASGSMSPRKRDVRALGDDLVEFATSARDLADVEASIFGPLPVRRAIVSSASKMRISPSASPMTFLSAPSFAVPSSGLGATPSSALLRRRVSGVRRSWRYCRRLPSCLQQRLDAREHGVQVFRQTVHFVAVAGDREAPRDRRAMMAAADSGHGVDAHEHAARHEQAADRADRHEPDPRELPSARRRILNAGAPVPLDVVADEQAVIAWQDEDAHSARWRAFASPGR